MLRGHSFEFAGRASDYFGLKLYYIENSYDKFDSGGKYNVRKDTIPYYHEEILYGKDYSSNPLEFEIEIISEDGEIPFTKMIEIKNWLYGQDGWRDLTISDETKTYHLKCLLLPIEDKVVNGRYIGVKCQLHNASPFWYGDEREILFTHSDLITNTKSIGESVSSGIKSYEYSVINIYIPDNDYAIKEFFPIFIFKDRRYDYSSEIASNDNSDNYTCITNTNVSTISDGLQSHEVMVSGHNFNVFDNENTQSLWFKTNGMSESSFTSNDYDNITLDSRYAIVNTERFADNPHSIYVKNDSVLPTPVLHVGNNICRVRHPHYYESLIVRYTPEYRMGAF